jgi:large-conductance mechanosensitive channel
MSCLGWNNVGSFFVQILGLLIIRAVFFLLSKMVLNAEKKRLEKMDLENRHKSFNELDQKNVELTLKRGKL